MTRVEGNVVSGGGQQRNVAVVGLVDGVNKAGRKKEKEGNLSEEVSGSWG